MNIKIGQEYTNFAGTRLVRMAGTYRNEKGAFIIIANLRMPGGKSDMPRNEFEQEFSEVVASETMAGVTAVMPGDVTMAEVAEIKKGQLSKKERKKKEKEKERVRAGQKYNPYIPEAEEEVIQ